MLSMLLLAVALPSQMFFEQAVFRNEANSQPGGWRIVAQRPEIQPKGWIDEKGGRRGQGALVLSGGSNSAAYGGWQRRLDAVQPGAWYRFSAYYRPEAVTEESLQVLARLRWIPSNNAHAGRPEYVSRVVGREGDWRKVELEMPSPENAGAVVIELNLGYCAQCEVAWDEVKLERIEKPRPRKVRIASLNYRPHKPANGVESVRAFVEAVDRAVDRADLIVLPEGITVVGTGKTDVEVSETIPGPATRALGEIARKKHSYLIAGIYERDGQAVYNTAVLLDREGAVAGRYRKVYLPREEVEAGLTPGNDYPVFQTDFGKIGMMICWDVQYADPARALALRGAEIIAFPIWDGDRRLGLARAVENHVFVASSGYGYPTQVMDPDGEVLAEARQVGQAAIAEVDLNRRYTDDWLGHMRDRFFHELRHDVPVRGR
ncbi:MAG: carbon-nitrogen hydrolase family protein [Acidobacteria bacterium]|nr:carbon-nitrogen hydrolase family protein [Acidobacteriota bacterium]